MLSVAFAVGSAYILFGDLHPMVMIPTRSTKISVSYLSLLPSIPKTFDLSIPSEL